MRVNKISSIFYLVTKYFNLKIVRFAFHPESFDEINSENLSTWNGNDDDSRWLLASGWSLWNNFVNDIFVMTAFVVSGTKIQKLFVHEILLTYYSRRRKMKGEYLHRYLSLILCKFAHCSFAPVFFFLHQFLHCIVIKSAERRVHLYVNMLSLSRFKSKQLSKALLCVSSLGVCVMALYSPTIFILWLLLVCCVFDSVLER